MVKGTCKYFYILTHTYMSVYTYDYVCRCMYTHAIICHRVCVVRVPVAGAMCVRVRQNICSLVM